MLKKTIFWTYFTQLYVSVVGIVMMPIYVRYLGAEGLGLVGFFVMLSTWLQLLDMGMSPTFSRQCAFFKGGGLSLIEIRKLLSSLELFYGALALITILVGLGVSRWLAEHWLRSASIDQSNVANSVAVMAGIIGLRWVSALYRGGLIGLERQADVNVITSIVATLKFVFVIPYFIFISSELFDYFKYQLFVGFLEALLYGLLFRIFALPACNIRIWPSIQVLKRVMPFAGSVALTSSISVALANIDKVVLSKTLSLNDYGYFSLAVIISGGILYFISPVSQVFQPRFSALVAENKPQELRQVFGELTQFVCALMSGLGFTIALFAEPLVLIWTGNEDVARQVAPILFWYVLGNAVIGILTLPYMLQFAHGKLRFHLVGIVVLAVALFPMVVLSSISYGAVGAGRVWCLANLLFLFLWIPIVFKYCAFEDYWRWLTNDVFVPSIGAVLPIAAYSSFSKSEFDGLRTLMYLMILGVVGVVFGILAGDGSRKRVFLLIFSDT